MHNINRASEQKKKGAIRLNGRFRSHDVRLYRVKLMLFKLIKNKYRATTIKKSN